ncbi:1422_t:CDS:10 [Ambispora leptoticha]|uniref:1422_t:CDS:1 n=1 Tax=Ambispora leptoticha TaxID=144679 RepID=A0A9N9FS26_9GLOM|nr:1422_t:CDS:10 [Ambispora leptoticha]
MNFGLPTEINGLPSNRSNNSSFNPGPSKPYPDPIGDMQRFVTNLQNQINEKETTIKRLQERIDRLEQEKMRMISTNKFASPVNDFRSREADFRRSIDKAIESFLGGGVGEYTANRLPSWQKNSSVQAIVTSAHTAQPSIPERSNDENSTGAVNSIENGYTAASITVFQSQNEESPQETPEESSRDQQNYSNSGGSPISIDEIRSNTSTSTAITPTTGTTASTTSNRRTMQPQALREIFPQEDASVREIRQSQTKSFAHIDFQNNDALNRALEKHGLLLQNYGVPGSLRVEKGKPRAQQPRPQYQYPANKRPNNHVNQSEPYRPSVEKPNNWTNSYNPTNTANSSETSAIGASTTASISNQNEPKSSDGV